MKLFPALAAFALIIAGSPAHAVPGGKLDTLRLGAWICELPGDATTPPKPQPEHNFNVVPDSSYLTADGNRGTYLLLGDQLTFTSGVREGEQFVLESDATLRKLGHSPALRCVLAGDPSVIAPAPPADAKAANTQGK